MTITKNYSKTKGNDHENSLAKKVYVHLCERENMCMHTLIWEAKNRKVVCGDGKVLYPSGNDSYMNLYMESIVRAHTQVNVKTGKN